MKHDVHLKANKRLIYDPQNESSVLDGNFSEIRNKMDNVVGEGENGLLRNHMDTSKLESTNQFLQDSRRSAANVKQSKELQELREEVEYLKRELTQVKTKPNFDINKYKDNDDDVGFFTGFPTYDTMVLCFDILKDNEADMSRKDYDPNKQKSGSRRNLT